LLRSLRVQPNNIQPVKHANPVPYGQTVCIRENTGIYRQPNNIQPVKYRYANPVSYGQTVCIRENTSTDTGTQPNIVQFPAARCLSRSLWLQRFHLNSINDHVQSPAARCIRLGSSSRSLSPRPGPSPGLRSYSRLFSLGIRLKMSKKTNHQSPITG